MQPEDGWPGGFRNSFKELLKSQLLPKQEPRLDELFTTVSCKLLQWCNADPMTLNSSSSLAPKTPNFVHSCEVATHPSWPRKSLRLLSCSALRWR
jgi:hypothetical protein